MSEWAILKSYGFTAVEVIKETDVFVRFRKTSEERRAQKINSVRTGYFGSDGVLPWRGDEVQARLLAERLTSVAAEYERRKKVASEYMERECAKLLGDAQ